jgi:hypothetical protein
MTVESRLEIRWALESRKTDLGHTIINIIETCLWVLRVAHNKRTSQAIAILIRKVTVVPVCTLKSIRCQFTHSRYNRALVTYRLVWNLELVSEHIAWYDGTLIHEGSTVESVEAMLVNTMPMLNVDINNSE